MQAEKNGEKLGASIAAGAGWLISLRFFLKFVGIISTLIIARLLIPEDFGLYALSMSIFGFVELVRSFGFGMALIQNQEATKSHYNTAWSLHLTFSIIAAALLYIFSEALARLAGDTRLISAIEFLSLVFFLDGFTNIGIIEFHKKMEFDKEFIRQGCIKLGGFVITIPLVFYLQSYWALLYGSLATTLIGVLLSYYMHPFRARLSFVRWKELLRFSSLLQLNNILRYFDRHLGNILISRFIGTPAVGVFSLSKEMGTLTSIELVDQVNRAAYPAYSKVAFDKQKLRDTFLDVLGVTALMALPAGVGLSSLAPLVVPVLLGENWIATISLIKIIAIASVVDSFASSALYIFMAQAKQGINIVLNLFKIVLFLLMIIWLVPIFNIEGAALAMLGTSIILTPVTLIALCKSVGISVSALVHRTHRPIFATLIMYTFLDFFINKYPVSGTLLNDIILMTGLVIFGMIVFFFVLIIIWLLELKPEGAEANVLRSVHATMNLPNWLLPNEVPRV